MQRLVLALGSWQGLPRSCGCWVPGELVGCKVLLLLVYVFLLEPVVMAVLRCRPYRLVLAFSFLLV